MIKNNENSKIKHIRILNSTNCESGKIEIIGAIVYYIGQSPDIYLFNKSENLENEIDDKETKSLIDVITSVKEKVLEYRKQNPMLAYSKISEKGEITQHIIDDPKIYEAITAELNNAYELDKEGNITYHQLADIGLGDAIDTDQLANVGLNKNITTNQLNAMIGPDANMNKFVKYAAIAGISSIMIAASLFKTCSSETKSSTDIVVETTMESEEEQTKILPESPAGEDDYLELYNMARDYFMDPSKYPNGMDRDWIYETFGVGDDHASEMFFKGTNDGLSMGYIEMNYSFYEDLEHEILNNASSSIRDANANNISSVYASILNDTVNKAVEFYVSEKTRQGNVVDKEALVISLTEEFNLVAFSNIYGSNDYLTNVNQIVDDFFPTTSDDKMLDDCAKTVAKVASETGNAITTNQVIKGDNQFVISAGNFLKNYGNKYATNDMYDVIDMTCANEAVK